MKKHLSKIQLNNSQQGIILPAVLLLIAAAVILIYFVISSTAPFKDSFLSSLFPKPSSRAAGMVDVSLAPTAVTVNQNGTFLVGVNIDTKTSSPSAMELEVNYDPTILEATALEPGFFFTKVLVPASLTAGKATITLAQDIGGFKTGSGNVATLAFKALTTTNSPTQITLNPTTTQVASIGINGNDINTLTNSSVTVTSVPAVPKNAVMSVNGPSGTIPAAPEFPVTVQVQTGTDASNLFAVKLNFDSSKLAVSRIDTADSFITQWGNDPTYDNVTGTVTAIGGVPAPGYSSNTPATMVTVYFTGKAQGSAAINLDPESAVYRNSDNQNILGTMTGTSLTMAAPATPTPTPTPSAAPSVTPSASPVASVEPSPIASSSPVPSPTPTTCAISSANWVTSINPINEGRVVGLNVMGNGSCAGQTVNFTVLEDDGLLGTDPVVNQPPTVKFDTNGKAYTSWLAEFQADGFNGINNPPEYYFNATVDDITVKSADPLLIVNQAPAGTFNKGDANRDGVIDLVDLSVLLSNWNKTSGFNDELDYNDDTVINTFDFAGLVQLLILGGRI